MRQIKYKIPLSEKIVLVQLAFLIITFFRLFLLDKNKTLGGNLHNLGYLLTIFMFLFIVMRIINRYNIAIYIDRFQEINIVQKILIPKKLIRVYLKDVSKIIVVKNMIKVHYNSNNEEKTLFIPKIKGMNSEDIKELMQLFNDKEIHLSYMGDKDITTNNAAFAIVIFALIFVQLLILLLILFFPGF